MLRARLPALRHIGMDEGYLSATQSTVRCWELQGVMACPSDLQIAASVRRMLKLERRDSCVMLSLSYAYGSLSASAVH